MFSDDNIRLVIELTYMASVVCFILGLKRMSAPRTARGGNFLSMVGMGLGILATLLDPAIVTYEWIIAGLAIGAAVGIPMAAKVAMTSMPQMVALLNGFGGAGSTFVALAEISGRPGADIAGDPIVYVTTILSLIVGGITFSGSLVAFAKLQEILPGKPMIVGTSKFLNVTLLVVLMSIGIIMHDGFMNDVAAFPSSVMDGFTYGYWSLVIVAAALIMGITLVVPIGGADMPVVVSLLNSYSGIAVAMTGFVLRNNALIITGSLVGASGIILTDIMCKGMNRSLLNVLFGGFGAAPAASAGASAEISGSIQAVSPDEAALILNNSESVIIVPGYGMAVSQAQHIVKTLTKDLEELKIDVKFAIHPVAGRMPGHMNVLLAEAGIEYDKLFDMEQINDQFPLTDVAIVIGANDVVNPAAKTNPGSPIFGMPILNVEAARTVFVLKRGMNPGFAGIENELFYKDNTRMVFGDAKATVEGIINSLAELK